MPLAMMKHLEEDVPPVFMILDTYDKDVKVDNVLNQNVEPLFFCIRFLNTIYFMLSSVSLVNTFLSRLRCLFIYLWHLYVQLFLPHFSSGFRMNFVNFPDIFLSLQNLLPGTHLFCVYGDNWFQSVRYSCSIFTPPYLDMSGTPSAAWWQFLRTLTALQRSSPQKKSWQTRKKSLKPSRCCIFKIWNQNYLLHIFLAVRILWDKEEIRCCQGETWERCERNHRTDSGLLLNLKCTCKLVNFYAHSSPGERRCIHRLPRCLCVEVQPCTFSFQVCIFVKVKDVAQTNFFSLFH